MSSDPFLEIDGIRTEPEAVNWALNAAGVERWLACWPSSPHSNGRSWVSELGLAWPMHGRTGNGWVGRQPRPFGRGPSRTG